MNRNTYLHQLERLPIKEPSVADIQSVAPHLGKDQIRKILLAEDTMYFAVPPTRVKWGYIVLSYSKKYGLSFAFTSRTRKSYADGRSHGDLFSKNAYMYKAMQYAEAHWSEHLVIDNWVDVGLVYVQDPIKLTDRQCPTTKFVVTWAINRLWNELINDHSKPEWQLWDDAITQLALNDFETSELKGGRGGYSEFNCAFCGSGLSLSSCPNCHHQFRDDYSRCGWRTPLPPKIVDLLCKSGHKFSIDPALLWK